jgi:hypothetical protein
VLWTLSHRADPRCVELADRHYSRQKIGSKQFVPPGRCFVLYFRDKVGAACWVTSWPFAEYVNHQWAGAWTNSFFRNESGILSSYLIRQAIAATRWNWPEVPDLGLVTFIDTKKVKKKRDFGRCYRKAGFKEVGYTKTLKLLALQLLPSEMPEACAPLIEVALSA